MKVLMPGKSRGWRIATGALAAAFILSIAMLLAGCGDDTAEEASNQAENDQAGMAGSSAAGNAAQGYGEEQCLAEMTLHYGDAVSARQVCDAIRAGYGNIQPEDLVTVLPQVEKELGLSPQEGSPAPGSGGYPGQQAPATGGPQGGMQSPGSSSGWGPDGVDIQVPEPPAP